MAPTAINPPVPEVQKVDSKISRPSLKRIDSSNMGTKRKIICFSDFDGTIFMQDTGHILFNNFGCGDSKRKILDEQIHSGERSFRDVSEEMWGSLNVPFDDGFEVMKEALEIDPHFQTFHEFCINNNIPFNVISAGLKPVLRKVLDHFLGEEKSSHIKIVANDADISPDGSKWKPIWLHDNDLGHDKELSIKEYREKAKLESEDGTIPLIIFIGDGVSDLPAAREADLLFARRGLRLEEYCIENKIPYIPFDTFADIQRELIKIARLDQQQTGGEGLPAVFNPRANMWRRISSKSAVPTFAMFSPREEKMLLWPDIFTQLHQTLEASKESNAPPRAELTEKMTIAPPVA